MNVAGKLHLLEWYWKEKRTGAGTSSAAKFPGLFFIWVSSQVSFLPSQRTWCRKVYVRSGFHLHMLKIPMLVNFEKLVALSLYLCYYASVLFWRKGVCQIYVSTSLLGATEGEALISALKLIWVIFPESLQAMVLIIWPSSRMPWRWHETNMLTHTHTLGRRVGKSKQKNKRIQAKPNQTNQNKAKQTFKQT